MFKLYGFILLECGLLSFVEGGGFSKCGEGGWILRELVSCIGISQLLKNYIIQTQWQFQKKAYD